MVSHQTVSVKVLQQEVEFLQGDIARLVRAVESMVVRMRQVERWQTTMDTTLKLMSESN